jgi:hypothetical protein
MKTRKSFRIYEEDTSLEIIIDDVNGRASIWMDGVEVVRMSSTAFTPVLDQSVVGGDLDLGSSGAAGSLDIFPSTESKGKLTLSAVDNTGDTQMTIRNAAQSATAIWTLPDTAGNADFVMTAAAQTIGGAKTFSAAIVPSGGVAAATGTAIPNTIHTGGRPATVSTDGTDTTPSVTETYYAQVFVPANMTVTGVALFNGSAVAGNVRISMLTSAGVPIAAALTASTAQSGTDAYQRIPFASPWAAVGPATYYVAVQFNNTGARFNSHVFGDFVAGKKTGETFGTFTTVTVGTTFTASLGPYASLY